MITGKEALIALANGESVQIECAGEFFDIADHREFLNVFDDPANKFRLKPRTITINGVEVPSPFEPEYQDEYWHITVASNKGYQKNVWTKHTDIKENNSQFGAWRTEDEIKQVVAALRSVFK